VRQIPFLRSELEGSVVERFEKIASQFGDRIAVKCRERASTCADLNAAANRVCHTLLSRTGDAAEPIGLLLDHDERLISTLLGVLKAGKFYAPLDPSYPVDRLSFIVNHCQPAILVADAAHAAQARALAPEGTGVLETLDLFDDRNEGNPGRRLSPDLAAVFYTSGSTGRPKGVMQSHRLVLHRVMADVNALQFTPDDRMSDLGGTVEGHFE
jgi:non-ribosomal peptide synthetase component F